MSRPEVMKVLMGARERRRSALDASVRDAMRRQQDADAQAQAARQALSAAQTTESEARDKLLALTRAGETFDVERLMQREHLLATRSEAVSRQRAEADQCETTLKQRSDDLHARRAERIRNDRKIEALRDGLRAWQEASQRDADDAQDEEAEEAAIARLMLRSGEEDRP